MMGFLVSMQNTHRYLLNLAPYATLKPYFDMISKKAFFCLLFGFVILSCIDKKPTENDEMRASELQIQERELELREKELALKARQLDMLRESSTSSDPSLVQMYEDVNSSVFLIYTKKDSLISQGTAFTVSSDGIAVSNYHVFEDAEQAIAINNQEEKFMITEILEIDKENDFIIFRLGPAANFPYLKIASLKPKVGENCFTVGNPEALARTLSTGIISAHRGKLLQTTCEITHGSSGGPLFDSKGHVIGITTSGAGTANLNFAVGIENLPLEKYLSGTTPNLSSPNFSDDTVLGWIQRYYSVVQEERWDDLLKLYAPNLKRFYSDFDMARVTAVENAMAYKKRFGVISSNYSIHKETLLVRQSSGTIYASFRMTYTMVRSNKNKPSDFELNIIMAFDDAGIVKGVYENILSKK